MLGGLLLPFSGAEAAFSSFSLLDLILALVVVGALALPVILARSSRTDVPVTYETFLCTLALVVLVVLLVKLIGQPEGGLQTGFYLALAGCLVLNIAGWKSVAREN